jgi:hypothetical protein
VAGDHAPGGLTSAQERQVAVDLFNQVWELLEMQGRTPDLDDRMVHCAHASRYHWGVVGEPLQLVVGEWQCSRVYAVLGRAEPSLHHARRSLEICDEAGIAGWPRASALEALARAHAVAGDLNAAALAAARARGEAAGIDDEDDLQVFERDMASLPFDLGKG